MRQFRRRQARSDSRRRRSALPTKPPYRSSSTSGVARRPRPLVHLRPDGAHVGQRAPRARHARMRCVQVDAPALRPSPGVSVFRFADHHRRLVEVDALDRQARHAFGQVGGAREHAQADRRRRRGRTARDGSWRQIPDETSFLLVGWLASGHTTARQPRSAGNMPDTCRNGCALSRVAGRPISRGHAVLLVQAEGRSRTACGCLLADQARQRDGGAHVGQRVVRRLVQQAVGARQVFQLEAGPAVLAASATRCLRAAAHRSCAPRRAGPSGRNRSAIRARTGRSGCARTGSA